MFSPIFKSPRHCQLIKSIFLALGVSVIAGVGLTDGNCLNFDNGLTQIFHGQIGGFYGGGEPHTQNDSRIAVNFDTIGATGQTWDKCLNVVNVDGPLAHYPDYTFFGIYVLFRPLDGDPVDLTTFREISFDIRTRSPQSHDRWEIRLEDKDGAEEWRNTTIPLPPLSHQWQHVSIPLYQFLVQDPEERRVGLDGNDETAQQMEDGLVEALGYDTVVDLSKAEKIVFAAEGPKSAFIRSSNVDLQIDNICFEQRECPRILVFHYPKMELSNQMRDWMRIGDGSILSRSCVIKEVDVSNSPELVDRYEILRVPVLLTLDHNQREIARIHFDNDYSKFCQDITAATGVSLLRD